MHRDRLGLHQTVALDDAEDDHLAGSAPAALALASAAEGCFIAFEAAFERLPKMLRMRHRQPDQAIEPLRRRPAGHQREALPIDRDAPHEPLHQPRLHPAIEPAGIP